MHTLRQLVIVAGVIGCVACHRSPTGPSNPAGPLQGGAIPDAYSTPPIRGLVREVNGGPIAGVGMRLMGPWPRRSPDVLSDETGGFALPSSTDVCGGPGSVELQVFKNGYRFPPAKRIACAQTPALPEVALELKGQPALDVVAGRPLQVTLSNDDVDWTADYDGYQCGPCKMLSLKLPPQDPVAIRVEWSGPDPLRLWIEGDVDYQTVRIGELIPSPGETAMTLVIPIEWRLYNPWILKIGLPYGGRFPDGSPPVTVHIEMKSSPQ